jgi:hypothetical protein
MVVYQLPREVQGWVRKMAGPWYGQQLRPFNDAMALDEAAPRLQVPLRVDLSSQVFVRVVGQAGGIIRRADLQNPLFDILAQIRMRFSNLID